MLKKFGTVVTTAAVGALAFAQAPTGTDFSSVRTSLNAEWGTGVAVVLGIFGLALGINFVMRRLRSAAK